MIFDILSVSPPLCSQNRCRRLTGWQSEQIQHSQLYTCSKRKLQKSSHSIFTMQSSLWLLGKEIILGEGSLFIPCGPAGCETTPHLSLGVDDPVEQMLHLVRQAGRVLPVLSAPQRLVLTHPGGGAVQQTHRLSGRQERGERSQAFVIWSVRTSKHLIIFFYHILSLTLSQPDIFRLKTLVVFPWIRVISAQKWLVSFQVDILEYFYSVFMYHWKLLDE